MNRNLVMPWKNGVTSLRYIFAYVLIIFHYNVLSGHDVFWLLQGEFSVKAFFILTGFLTFYSYFKRPGTKEFAKRRFKRLVPSYAFVIMLSFLACSLISEYSFSEYFSSPQSFKYLISNLLFLNFLCPDLPGVFTNNLSPAVNGSLWTMKVDIMFYVTVPLLYYLFRKYPKRWVLLAILAITILYNEIFEYLYIHSGNSLYLVLKRQIGGQYIYFLVGMCIYFYYQQIHSQRRWLLPISVIIFLVGSYYHSWEYVTAFCYAVIIMELSLNTKILSRFSEVPNITYGLYLFHFPVIQTLLHFKVNEWSHTGCCMLTLAIVTLLSIMSYQLIEKRIR